MESTVVQQKGLLKKLTPHFVGGESITEVGINPLIPQPCLVVFRKSFPIYRPEPGVQIQFQTTNIADEKLRWVGGGLVDACGSTLKPPLLRFGCLCFGVLGCNKTLSVHHPPPHPTNKVEARRVGLCDFELKVSGWFLGQVGESLCP